MPARGYIPRAGRLAAALYLKAKAEGDSLTIPQVAERFGVNPSTVRNSLCDLRKERAAEASAAGIALQPVTAAVAVATAHAPRSILRAR